MLGMLSYVFKFTYNSVVYLLVLWTLVQISEWFIVVFIPNSTTNLQHKYILLRYNYWAMLHVPVSQCIPRRWSVPVAHAQSSENATTAPLVSTVAIATWVVPRVPVAHPSVAAAASAQRCPWWPRWRPWQPCQRISNPLHPTAWTGERGLHRYSHYGRHGNIT